MTDKIFSISTPAYLTSLTSTSQSNSPILSYLNSLGACTISQSDILAYLYERDAEYAEKGLGIVKGESTYYIGDYSLEMNADAQQELRSKAWIHIGEFYEKKIKTCTESVLFIESVDVMDSFLVENMDWMLFCLVTPKSEQAKEYSLKKRGISEEVGQRMQRNFDWDGQRLSPGWHNNEADIVIEIDEENDAEWKAKVKRLFETNHRPRSEL